VSRTGGGGLFGAIFKLVRFLPLIVVPRINVQPVLIEDVIEQLVAVVRAPEDFYRREIDIALPPRTLARFVQDVGLELGVKRVVLSLPVSLFEAILSAVSRVSPGFPLTAGHLQGLMYGSDITPVAGLTPFGIPGADTPTEKYLEWECRHLYRVIFQREPSLRILERYCQYHSLHPELVRQRETTELLQQGYDLEVIEYRRRVSDPWLSQKFKLLSYLSEVSPEMAQEFTKERASVVTGYLVLGLAVCRSGIKLLLNWRSR
jgi:hypothetical protein